LVLGGRPTPFLFVLVLRANPNIFPRGGRKTFPPPAKKKGGLVQDTTKKNRPHHPPEKKKNTQGFLFHQKKKNTKNPGPLCRRGGGQPPTIHPKKKKTHPPKERKGGGGGGGGGGGVVFFFLFFCFFPSVKKGFGTGGGTILTPNTRVPKNLVWFFFFCFVVRGETPEKKKTFSPLWGVSQHRPPQEIWPPRDGGPPTKQTHRRGFPHNNRKKNRLPLFFGVGFNRKTQSTVGKKKK